MLLEKLEYVLAISTVTFGAAIALFDSLFYAAVIISTYVVGLIWGAHLVQFFSINISFFKEVRSSYSSTKNVCNVCHSGSCKRHKKHVQSQWVKVPKDFDSALENLFEKLLQDYICAWYSDFSSNKAFVQQLRLGITTASRNLAGRLLSSDVPEIVFNHLVPVVLQHAQDWQELTKRSKVVGDHPQDHVLNYLGNKIHPAAYSRKAEIDYLRGISTILTPLLLPTTHISTNNEVILREILANWLLLPAMDALADPDNINTLIILSTYYEGEFSEATDAFSVPLLHFWISSSSNIQNASSALKPTLDEILNDQELLYIFMQHIKESGPVSLLQFFLDIDDLSKRMLNPDMTPEIEQTLFDDAQNIYTSYLHPESADYVHLSQHVSEGIKNILDGGPEKIQELRTSRPLYQAHQEAHALLGSTCLPSFHHSYELHRLICGASTAGSALKPTASRSSSVSSGVGTKLSNQLGKIRGALRVAAVDGASFDAQQVYQAEEVSCSSDIIEKCAPDLTTWRVTIPHVDVSSTHPLYMVSIHSATEEKSWTVLRRDQDFHSLRSRLAEFHGDKELEDSLLPTRKNQPSSVAANRQIYQDFLQKLLTKPTLRNSQLLRIFLTAHNLKPHLSAYSASDIGLLYQNVTHKLRKEKGQHLDKFMSVFLTSTNIKQEHPDVGVEVSTEQGVSGSKRSRKTDPDSGIFGNNLDLDSRIQEFPYVGSKRKHVKGVCYCIAEAMDTLLNISSMKSQVIWLFASTLRKRLDPVINRGFHNVLVKLLSGGRAALVVRLLQSAIFDADCSRKESLPGSSERYNRAKNGLRSLLPWWFLGAHSQWCKLMDSFLDPLQNPALNKHLAYVLLDQLLINLYPELATQSQMFGS